MCPANWLNLETKQPETRLIDDCRTAVGGMKCPHYASSNIATPPISPVQGEKYFEGGCCFPHAIRLVDIGLPRLEAVEDKTDA